MKISDMSVELVDHMGSDLSVVNAARVSFDKVSGWEMNPDLMLKREGDWIRRLQDKDVKLIEYLAKHNHWTPFGHASLSYRIKAPIFVARQLVKHQVGLVWNEVSRRYVDYEPEFWFPKVWRGRPTGGAKQGSSSEKVTHLGHVFDYTGEPQDTVDDAVKYSVEHSLFCYEEMIKAGVAPEQARMVLPLNTHTEWIWTGSLYAFARVCQLRLDPHAQQETRDIAVMISALARKYFPVSWKVLVDDKTRID